MVSLDEAAAGVRQERRLVAPLHAFGHDLQLELAGELKQDPDYHLARRVLADAADEAAVELEVAVQVQVDVTAGNDAPGVPPGGERSAGSGATVTSDGTAAVTIAGTAACQSKTPDPF